MFDIVAENKQKTKFGFQKFNVQEVKWTLLFYKSSSNCSSQMEQKVRNKDSDLK